MSYNFGLTGALPPELGSMSRNLTVLHIYSAGLTGESPMVCTAIHPALTRERVAVAQCFGGPRSGPTDLATTTTYRVCNQ